MKIAITGGAGFIGSHLTKAYLDAGHDVFVIDNLFHGTHQTIDRRARFYHIDIRDHKVATILQEERPDIVSHHAARRSDEFTNDSTTTDADVHIHGLLNMLESCVDASIKKFIFASGTHSMYGQIHVEHLPLHEDAPLCPQNACDISKVAGEWYVRHYSRYYGLRHTILRYSDVYGPTEPNLSHHPLNYFITMLLQHERPVIRGSGNEIRDHIFVDDVVQANLSALKCGDNCTLHISSNQGYTLNQLYALTSALLDCKTDPLYITGIAPHMEIPALVLDNALAHRILGWIPQFTLPEGIRHAITHLKEHKDRALFHKELDSPQMTISPLSPVAALLRT